MVRKSTYAEASIDWSFGMGGDVKTIFKLLAGLLLMGSVYGFFMLQQSPESGFDKNIPIAMVFGGLACAVLSIGGKSKYDTTGTKARFWKGLFLILLLSGFVAYYFFFVHKP